MAEGEEAKTGSDADGDTDDGLHIVVYADDSRTENALTNNGKKIAEEGAIYSTCFHGMDSPRPF